MISQMTNPDMPPLMTPENMSVDPMAAKRGQMVKAMILQRLGGQMQAMGNRPMVMPQSRPMPMLDQFGYPKATGGM